MKNSELGAYEQHRELETGDNTRSDVHGQSWLPPGTVQIPPNWRGERRHWMVHQKGAIWKDQENWVKGDQSGEAENQYELKK